MDWPRLDRSTNVLENQRELRSVDGGLRGRWLSGCGCPCPITIPRFADVRQSRLGCWAGEDRSYCYYPWIAAKPRTQREGFKGTKEPIILLLLSIWAADIISRVFASEQGAGRDSGESSLYSYFPPLLTRDSRLCSLPHHSHYDWAQYFRLVWRRWAFRVGYPTHIPSQFMESMLGYPAGAVETMP